MGPTTRLAPQREFLEAGWRTAKAPFNGDPSDPGARGSWESSSWVFGMTATANTTTITATITTAATTAAQRLTANDTWHGLMGLRDYSNGHGHFPAARPSCGQRAAGCRAWSPRKKGVAPGSSSEEPPEGGTQDSVFDWLALIVVGCPTGRQCVRSSCFSRAFVAFLPRLSASIRGCRCECSWPRQLKGLCDNNVVCGSFGRP